MQIVFVNQEPVEIKLRPPKLRPPKPGSKVANLANIIENQLNRRSVLKATGQVDPLQAAMDGDDPAHDLHSMVGKVEEDFDKVQSMPEVLVNSLGMTMCKANSQTGTATTL